MNFWIEHDAEGRVLAAYVGAGEQRALQGGILAEVDRLRNPAQCLYIDGVVLDLGPAPSDRHVLDVEARAWVVPGVSELELAQAAKWSQVKAERDRLETSGFPYLGKWIDSDARSVQRITGAVQAAQAALAAGAAFEIGWTCADDSVLKLDAQQMLGMTVALASHANALHVVARDLREVIYAEDATAASVAAVAWPAE